MVADKVHPAAVAEKRLLEACDEERLRRSGPGGQHRNKVETAVRLVHRPTGVRAEASERRSQDENRRVALGRLRIALALEVRRDCHLSQPASSLWQSRIHGGRIELSAKHDDFPVLLAEALDTIAACGADVHRSAERLGCSMSQLIKLLKKEPHAWTLVGRWRAEQGLHRLK